jgi:hypothetical protein
MLFVNLYFIEIQIINTVLTLSAANSNKKRPKIPLNHPRFHTECLHYLSDDPIFQTAFPILQKNERKIRTTLREKK